ncbi:L,D-transpeptidase family protein [Chitinophaga oryziterrae]|uniref:L,D-transpeptidase family protein n=1 Tax=Chitinophaga oryziterrae TaxID=1031224 RepID=A0A6N8J616_9BACT|nr:L,D-transpeptidase family protein [Chitinophaga oryziterrae]MVT39622.1 L,D-transpeptidase family protein [Chitinophaga oryziterrae]
MKYNYKRGNLLYIAVLFVLFACHRKKVLREREVVKNVAELQEVIPENIAERLNYIADNDSKMEDKIPVLRLSALQYFYEQTGNAPGWSSRGILTPSADTLFNFILNAEQEGLQPADYHFLALNAAFQLFRTDETAKKDAALLAQLDIMMTDAFMKMASDLHYGIAPRDSITFRKDSVFTDTLLTSLLRTSLQENNVGKVLHQLEPQHPGYVQLKIAMRAFERKYAPLRWDTLPTSYTDTIAFRQLLINRLVQTHHLDTSGGHATDTSLLKKGILAFQKEFNMYEDGLAGKKTVQTLNRPFRDWMIQGAVNMDRWRKLPDTLPPRFILVNVPGYRMELWDSGRVVLESRVIVGAPRTRTPLLNSRMTNFVMFPFWRVPFSITIKEMLPAIKKDPGYLTRKNLEVIDRDGNAVNPDSVNWNRMSKNYFPYVLRQMDGMENSLGIMKFNFFNKYSVYLHDTNNHGLFRNTYRAMSHGCVRLQQWDSLAMYLIKNDTRHPRDSVRAWLSRGEKRMVDIQRPVPIFLRYFTAEGKDGQIVFHEDIYGEDKVMRKLMRL